MFNKQYFCKHYALILTKSVRQKYKYFCKVQNKLHKIMNCENIKKGDKVVVFFQSDFTRPSKTLYTVKRVYKNVFVIDDGRKYRKIDGTIRISRI